jgi:hypothetical protein
MTNLLKPALSSLVLLAALMGQTQKPERKVEGNILRSAHDPAIRIQLPKAVTYAGADRWILYGVADCELHAFAETDAKNNVNGLYWVQFEGYIPSRPDLHYGYDSPRHVTIAGTDFFLDTWVRSADEQIKADSDREHIEALVSAKGLKMPASMAYVRLVHLLDSQKRKELMIIYGEDLAPTGFSAADLGEGGKAREQWPAVEQRVIENAKRKIMIAAEAQTQ